jgi:HEPN domain-containing protein
MVFWRRTNEPTPPPAPIPRCCACSAAVGDADALLIRERWPICPTCVASVRTLLIGADDAESAPTWIVQARDDLDTAREMLERRRLHLVMFFCHEAMEKALIGFLLSKADRRTGTHSIYTLAKRAAALDARFRDIGTDAWTLDTLYVFSRYPFGMPFKAPKEFFTDIDDATAAVTVASQVVALASEAMPKASGA